MSLIPKDPLIVFKDVQFIHVLYSTPISIFVQMDEGHLRHTLGRTKLVCRWLEDILELMTELEPETKGK
jgi:hypothetical protein